MSSEKDNRKPSLWSWSSTTASPTVQTKPEPLAQQNELEQTSALKSTPKKPVAQERRKNTRARLRLKVRARTADYRDGEFEEVRDTINTSRKSCYFDTAADRYYPGMRLRVNFPYEPESSLEQEHLAQVVRVDRKPGSFGVALTLAAQPSASAPAPIESKAVQARPRVRDRRLHERASMIAAVELMDMITGTLTHARTSDVSPAGCYVDTLNPLPLGTIVQLSIQRGSETIDLHAIVCTTHTSSGMGLRFHEPPHEQKTRLENWLAQSSASALPRR